MKKLLVFILTIGVVFTLAGCSSMSREDMKASIAQTNECVDIGFSRKETVFILGKKYGLTEEQANQVIMESRPDWRLAAMNSAVTFLFIGDNQYSDLRDYLTDLREFTDAEADYVIDIFDSAIEQNPNLNNY